MKQITFSANIPVSFFKEGSAYIAHCPVLDVSTSAATFEQVKHRFSEAINIFFEELVDMGTLDEVLSNLGWTKIQQRWTPPFSIGHDVQNISIPLSA